MVPRFAQVWRIGEHGAIVDRDSSAVRLSPGCRVAILRHVQGSCFEVLVFEGPWEDAILTVDVADLGDIVDAADLADL